MGWCAGTEIFDAVADEILIDVFLTQRNKRILKALANALKDMDWDCQSDSKYFDHPLVKEVFDELNADEAARRGG